MPPFFLKMASILILHSPKFYLNSNRKKLS
jgi:hypothetical protein